MVTASTAPRMRRAYAKLSLRGLVRLHFRRQLADVLVLRPRAALLPQLEALRSRRELREREVRVRVRHQVAFLQPDEDHARFVLLARREQRLGVPRLESHVLRDLLAARCETLRRRFE